jgi:cellulose synthase/poly-beta-1,6-N-acetylglucosamine synthase-like glycosyltransferase
MASLGLAAPHLDPLPLGEALLARGITDEATLEWGLRRQRETGERLGRILLAAGKVERLELQRALGEQWGIPFIDLLRTPLDATLTRRFDPDRLVAEGWMPVRREGDRVVVATSEPPGPALTDAVREVLGDDVVVDAHTTTPLDVERSVLSCFRDKVVERSTIELLSHRPELSAASGCSGSQRLLLAAALVAAATVAIALSWELAIAVLVTLANLVFLGAIGFKLVACVAGLGARVRQTHDEPIDDRDLPRYTVLVPVYREANIIGDLIANLGALDYPEEKLEILVLLESDDLETIEAARAARPPSTVHLVVVPDAEPKTKPKACNIGLFLATGEQLVIYDAEDRPEPRQLRKAVAAFRRSGEDTICVQSYWNAGSNLLTRMFGLEYGYWFGAMLPGLDRLRLPIPLDGTSNHFRVDALRRLGGWDPHNVTEDADLGLRAAVEGYRVGVIESFTDEEACSRLRPWIRQRTRWIKGYMQTSLVHTRSPIRMVRRLGIKNALGFLLLVAGTPLTFLLAPVLWVGTASWYVLGEPQLPMLDTGLFWAVALCNLLAGNALMIVLNATAALRDRGWGLVLFALLNPVYWILHSWAAWRALIQLVRNPFLWEKTPHGLTVPDGTGAERTATGADALGGGVCAGSPGRPSERIAA